MPIVSWKTRKRKNTCFVCALAFGNCEIQAKQMFFFNPGARERVDDVTDVDPTDDVWAVVSPTFRPSHGVEHRRLPPPEPSPVNHPRAAPRQRHVHATTEEEARVVAARGRCICVQKKTGGHF